MKRPLERVTVEWGEHMKLVFQLACAEEANVGDATSDFATTKNLLIKWISTLSLKKFSGFRARRDAL